MFGAIHDFFGRGAERHGYPLFFVAKAMGLVRKVVRLRDVLWEAQLFKVPRPS